ncbi:hypothetical protein [Pseudarthrobacter sp. S9]|uniref:hypothetical protein n=1 Tax=Pseudarthrobacter sp. S9 TaxID=3418421 RepID=UPI003D00861D
MDLDGVSRPALWVYVHKNDGEDVKVTFVSNEAMSEGQGADIGFSMTPAEIRGLRSTLDRALAIIDATLN